MTNSESNLIEILFEGEMTNSESNLIEIPFEVKMLNSESVFLIEIPSEAKVKIF